MRGREAKEKKKERGETAKNREGLFSYTSLLAPTFLRNTYLGSPLAHAVLWPS